MPRSHPRAAPGDDLLRDGVIQRFEYTYELSHKFLCRFLEEARALLAALGRRLAPP